MAPLTLLQLVERHDNDYSSLEPFLPSEQLSSSVIVPVYNHVELLALMLGNLSRNKTLQAFGQQMEVIIVDDGSKEDIASAVRKAQLPCPTRYIRFPENQGRCAARNEGIRQAAGELLFFFDSDILIPQGYFEEHWKVHRKAQEYQKKAVVLGLAENIFSDDVRVPALVQGENLVPDITKDFRFYNDTLWRSVLTEPHFFIGETNWFKQFGTRNSIDFWTLPEMVVTHNMSVSRDDALAVGGFDVRFHGWGYEDTHFGAKMIALGSYVIPLQQTGIFRMYHPLRNGTKEQLMLDRQRNKAIYERLMQEQFIHHREPIIPEVNEHEHKHDICAAR